MSWTLSQRAQKLTSSAIREILKVTERPEVISFAGGLPSPDTFPVERLRAKAVDVLTNGPSPALQYGPTEGYMQLREWIAQRYSTPAVRIDPQNVLVTTGSQQALDLLGKTLIDSVEGGRGRAVERGRGRAGTEKPDSVARFRSLLVRRDTHLELVRDDRAAVRRLNRAAVVRERRGDGRRSARRRAGSPPSSRASSLARSRAAW